MQVSPFLLSMTLCLVGDRGRGPSPRAVGAQKPAPERARMTVPAPPLPTVAKSKTIRSLPGLRGTLWARNAGRIVTVPGVLASRPLS